MIAQDPALTGVRPTTAAKAAARDDESRPHDRDGRAADFDTVLKGRPARKPQAGREAPEEAAAAAAPAPAPAAAVTAVPAPVAAGAVPEEAALPGGVAGAAEGADAAGPIPLPAVAEEFAGEVAADAVPAEPAPAGDAVAVAGDEAGDEAGARAVAVPVVSSDAAVPERSRDGGEAVAVKAAARRPEAGAARQALAALPLEALAPAEPEGGAEPMAALPDEPVRAEAAAAGPAGATAPKPGVDAGQGGAAAAMPPAGAVAVPEALALAPAARAGEAARTETAAAPAAPQASAVVGQVVVAMGKAHDPRIEIRLDPPELGRVHIHLTPTDGGVQAVVAADRPETQDLLRRHADLLARELADAGYGGVQLDFAAGNDATPRQGAEGAAPEGAVASIIAPAAAGAPAAIAPAQPLRLVTGGLDIRL